MTDEAPATTPTFAQRAAQLIETAVEGDTIVVASANKDYLMLQTRPTSAADLVQIARAVLDQAASAIERERVGAATRLLATQVATALAALPDPHADEEEDGDDGT